MEILGRRLRLSAMAKPFKFFVLSVLSSGFAIYFAGPAVLGAQDEGAVTVVIRNKTYEFHGGVLRPGLPATLVLENRDEIEHGFISALLEELSVRVETEDGLVFGEKIQGVHILPGKTVRIHFTPTRPGSFSFRCDIHPSMKGELLLLSVGAI